MDDGDSCNTSKWTLANHMGTHIDFPGHSINDGQNLNDYPADFFIFEHVQVIFVNPEPAQIISPQELHLNNIPPKTELLLIKTGYGACRNEPVYWQQNPGFSPELATHLRERFPSLRIMGFDSISLSSFAHREIGKRAHKEFLASPQPILPLEDMDLGCVSEAAVFEQVIVAPLRVAGADGTPCTVFAKMGQK